MPPSRQDLTFRSLLFFCLLILLLSGCGGKIVKETEAKTAPAPKPPPSVPMWLGNPSRNFFGTGPLSNDPLQVVWKVDTKMISGRLHKDPWGGTSWPGQPSVDGKYVYFGSADGHAYCVDGRVYVGSEDGFFYCLNLEDGSLIYKTQRLGSMEGSFAAVDGRIYTGTE